MELKEMMKDLLTRLYKETTYKLDNEEVSPSEAISLLRDAANAFSFACEKMRYDE